MNNRAGGLTVEVGTAPTAAGRAVAVPVRITNSDERSTRIRLSAVGLENGWGPDTPWDLELAGGQVLDTSVELCPPVGTVPAAYPWSLTVQVLDEDGGPSGVPEVVTGMLLVDERPRVGLSVQPAQARGWRAATVRVRCDNTSPTWAWLRLRATGAEGLRIRLPHEPVGVPARASTRVRVRVLVRRPRLFGGHRRLPWTLLADDSTASTRVEGVMAARALLPNRLAKVVAAVSVVSLWLGLVAMTVPKLPDLTGIAGRRHTSAGGSTAAGSDENGSGKSHGKTDGTGSSGGSPSGTAAKKASAGTGAAGTGTGNGVRFFGTVGGADSRGVRVAVKPVPLVDEEVATAQPIGATVKPIRAAGKILGLASARFPLTTLARERITTTDEGGAWAFEGIESPGYYLLRLSKPGYQTERFVLDAADPAAREPLDVELTAGAGQVEGLVLGTDGKPVGGAQVTVSDGTTTVAVGTPSSTKGKGRFLAQGLSTPGTYLVSATSPGTALASRLVHLGAGGNARVELRLTRGRMSIRGTVTAYLPSKNWSPFGGATVTATDGTRTRTVTSLTDEHWSDSSVTGMYLLPDLPLGNWTVTVSADGYLPQITRLVLKGDRPDATFNPALRPSTALVQGTVVDAVTGKGIDLGVGLTLEGKGGTFKTTAATTPPGGFVLTGIPPGTYTLTASVFGYQDTSVPVEADAAVLDPELLTVPLHREDGTGPPGTGKITGTVIDGRTLGPVECSKATPNCVHVSLRSTDDVAYPLERSVDIKPEAPYVLPSGDEGLSPGLYLVEASAPGYESARTKVRVPQGEIATAPVLTLFPFAQIVGTVGTRAGWGLPANTCVLAVRMTKDSPDPLVNMTGVKCDIGAPVTNSPSPSVSSTPSASNSVLPARPSTVLGGVPRNALGPYARFEPPVRLGSPARSQASDPPDATGCPVRGPTRWCAAVGSDGRFVIPEVRRGSYQIVVVPTDAAFLPTAVSTITLAAGEIRRYEATLDRLGMIKVNVREMNGAQQAVPAVGVSVQLLSSQAKTTMQATTGEDGEAVLDRVPVGTYTVLAAGQTAAVGLDVGLNSLIKLSYLLRPGNSYFLGHLVRRIDGVPGPVPLNGANADVVVTAVVGLDGLGNPLRRDFTVRPDGQGCFAVLQETSDYVWDTSSVGCPAARVPLASRSIVLTIPETRRTQPLTVTVGTFVKDSGSSWTGQDVVLTAKRHEVSVNVTADTGTPDYGRATVTVTGPQEAGVLWATVTGSSDLPLRPLQIRDSSTAPEVWNSLLPGTYTIAATVPGYTSAVCSLLVPENTNVPSCTLTLHQLRTVKVQVKRAVEPADGAVVVDTRVTLTVPGRAKQVQTSAVGDDASFSFPDQSVVNSDGQILTFSVTVEAAGYRTQSQSDQTFGTENTAVVEVTLERLGAVRITVMDQTEYRTSFLPGVTVTAAGNTGTYTAVTGNNGSAVLAGTLAHNGLEPGQYSITVAVPAEYTLADPAPIFCDVEIGKTCEMTVIVRPVGVTVQVRVHAPDGTGLPGATVTLTSRTSTENPSGLSGTTDATGLVVFQKVVPTDYTIKIQSDPHDQTEYRSIETVVYIGPSAEIKNLEFTLNLLLNDVELEVTDNDGTAMAGASAELRPTSADPIPLTAVTGQVGRYAVSGIPQGSYTLAVTHPSHVTVEQSKTLSGGKTFSWAVTMIPARQNVEITVTDASATVPLDGASVSLEVVGSPGESQSATTLVAEGANTWKATFLQVPRGTYTAVYKPVTGELHHGTGQVSGISVAPQGADLTKTVSAQLTVDEYPVTVMVSNPAVPPYEQVKLAWELPAGTSVPGAQDLTDGLLCNTNSAPITYYLPSSVTGTWKVTATPQPEDGFVTDTQDIVMTDQGPDPSTVELTIKATNTPSPLPTSTDTPSDTPTGSP